MSTTATETVTSHITRVLEHGENHVGGRDGARRHAQSVIDRALAGQCLLDASQEEIDAAQAVVDAYTV